MKEIRIECLLGIHDLGFCSAKARHMKNMKEMKLFFGENLLGPGPRRFPTNQLHKILVEFKIVRFFFHIFHIFPCSDRHCFS
jgi:hypothetical protein